jgi:hypothetical protein
MSCVISIDFLLLLLFSHCVSFFFSFLDTTFCEKMCQWLAADRWLFPGTPVSSTHKITTRLLKVALNTITLTCLASSPLIFFCYCCSLIAFHSSFLTIEFPKYIKTSNWFCDLLLLSNAPHRFICDSELYAHVQFRVRVCYTYHVSAKSDNSRMFLRKGYHCILCYRLKWRWRKTYIHVHNTCCL